MERIRLIILAAALQGGGFFSSFPEFDIPLQFAGGIIGVLLGYYISAKLRKPTSKNDYNFCNCFSFCFSQTLMIIRKLLQFFIDFYTGSNLTKCEFVADEHWLFQILGFGMSPWEQRPLMDMGEDFLMGTLGSLLSTGGIFIYIRLRHKEAFRAAERKLSALAQKVKNLPERFKEKIKEEKEKLTQQTNIWDLLLWWCVRAAMIYAFITMENRAEATLLGVNLLATFAVSLLHMVFPSSSFLCRISYRVQSLITVIVFLGSYCGNYVFVYGILSRYDLFLHFISGAVAVMAGYYVALSFIRNKTKTDSLIIALFAFTASLMIIPTHEMVEFIGDFIWGTSNQGFYWGPSDSSFFFKLFGHGVGNTQLYYLFDTMYDALLASFTSVLSAVMLYVFLRLHRQQKTQRNDKTDTEKQKVSC